MSTALTRIKEIVPGGNFVVLDTETTGIDYRAEIVQIGIVGSDGATLMNCLLKPSMPIPPEATAIHGITNAMVADAPRLADVAEQVRDVIAGRVVIVYNAEYDVRLLVQTSRMQGLATDWRSIPARWICAMLAYAEHRGEPGRRYGEFRWHKLGDAARHEHIEVTGAHDAIGDCLTTLALVKRLAGVTS
jgi:DNA polymerase III epsilon subunit-like protein